MDFQDWLLFLHILSAFVLVGSLTALWGLVFATRPAAPMIRPEDAARFGSIAGPLTGIGGMTVLIFGVWLTLKLDQYDLLDGWIIAALILWVIGTATGAQSGKLFQQDPVGSRGAAIRLQAINTVVLVALLILMIWKPGA